MSELDFAPKGGRYGERVVCAPPDFFNLALQVKILQGDGDEFLGNMVFRPSDPAANGDFFELTACYGGACGPCRSMR